MANANKPSRKKSAGGNSGSKKGTGGGGNNSGSKSNSSSSGGKKSGKSGASGSASMNATMQITTRITNVKRHTTGYVIGGKTYSVSETLRLASRGQIRNVRVVGNHIQSVSGARRLSELPTKVVKQ